MLKSNTLRINQLPSGLILTLQLVREHHHSRPSSIQQNQRLPVHQRNKPSSTSITISPTEIALPLLQTEKSAALETSQMNSLETVMILHTSPMTAQRVLLSTINTLMILSSSFPTTQNLKLSQLLNQIPYQILPQILELSLTVPKLPSKDTFKVLSMLLRSFLLFHMSPCTSMLPTEDGSDGAETTVVAQTMNAVATNASQLESVSAQLIKLTKTLRNSFLSLRKSSTMLDQPPLTKLEDLQQTLLTINHSVTQNKIQLTTVTLNLNGTLPSTS
jgi:hypothetical protein